MSVSSGDTRSTVGSSSSGARVGSGSRSVGTGNTGSGSQDEVDTALVSLLGVGAEPEPLQHACTSLGARSRGQVRRDGDVEVGVVGRERYEVLICVAVELNQWWPDDLVGCRVDNGDVGRALVRDG